MSLLHHQVKPHEDLLKVHKSHKVSLDASDTGTGKTYVAVHLAKSLGCRPLVLCPKSVIPGWVRVCKELEVEPLDILNPEKLKTGKTLWLTKKGKNKFSWRLPEDNKVLIIFDEVHQYGAPNSQNAMILATAKSTGCRIHCMSATIAETPLRLRGPGYIFGLHQWHDFYQWAVQHGCYRNPWNGWDFGRGTKAANALKKIRSELFPEFGVRVSIKDLEDFPEVTIQPEAYEFEQNIQEVYDEVEEELSRHQEEDVNPLVVMLRARQRTELMKVDLVCSMAKEHLDEGHSVVVFANFRETLKAMKECIEADGIAVSEIHGSQTSEAREWNIQQFQENKRHVCLAIITAGGVGVSLHDLKGRPRVSLIFPPLTARDLKQALGRIHRAGSLSPAIQKIVFAADSVEEDVCTIVRRKLNNLDLLNDGDMTNGILGN